MGKKFTQDGHKHELKWSVFTDDEWNKYLAAQKDGSLCKDRIALAKITKNFKVTSEGDIEFQVHEIFMPAQNSHYHYFLVSDCSLEFCKFIFHVILFFFSFLMAALHHI
jgi:hypothetical protein